MPLGSVKSSTTLAPAAFSRELDSLLLPGLFSSSFGECKGTLQQLLLPGFAVTNRELIASRIIQVKSVSLARWLIDRNTFTEKLV